MIVWRIASEAPAYSADDLTGEGAKRSGGRWNDKGVPVIYSSTSIALAALETLIHLDPGDLPLNRFLVQIDIPDSVWEARQAYDQNTVPGGWNAHPAGRTSIKLGSDWLRANSCALLEIPSIVVPEESNVLINPSHADSSSIRATTVRLWTYDRRLR